MENVDKGDQFLFSQLVVPGTVNMAAHRPNRRVQAMLQARMRGDHPSVVSSLDDNDNGDDELSHAGFDFNNEDEDEDEVEVDNDNHAHKLATVRESFPDDARSRASSAASDDSRPGNYAPVPSAATGIRPAAGTGWDVANRFRANTNQPRPVPRPQLQQLRSQTQAQAQAQPQAQVKSQLQFEARNYNGGKGNDNYDYNYDDEDEDEHDDPDADADAAYALQQRYGNITKQPDADSRLSHASSASRNSQQSRNSILYRGDGTKPAGLYGPSGPLGPTGPTGPSGQLGYVAIRPATATATMTESPLQKTIRECMQPPPPPVPVAALAPSLRLTKTGGIASSSCTETDYNSESNTGSAVESSVSHPYLNSRHSHSHSQRRRHHHRHHSRHDRRGNGSQVSHSRHDRDRRRHRRSRGSSSDDGDDRGDFTDVEISNKRELIAELDKLALGGTLLAFKPTMDHSVSELRHELERRLANTTLIQRVAFIKGIVKIIALVIELVLSTFMRVKNWSVFITENLDTGAYDQSLEQIYRSLWKRGAPSPWLNLGLLVIGSLLGFHFFGMQPSNPPATGAGAGAGAGAGSNSANSGTGSATAGKSLSAGIGGIVSSLMSGGGLGGMMSGAISGVTNANMPTRAPFPSSTSAPARLFTRLPVTTSIAPARPPSPPPIKPTVGSSTAGKLATATTTTIMPPNNSGERRRPRVSSPIQ